MRDAGIRFQKYSDDLVRLYVNSLRPLRDNATEFFRDCLRNAAPDRVETKCLKLLNKYGIKHSMNDGDYMRWYTRNVGTTTGARAAEFIALPKGTLSRGSALVFAFQTAPGRARSFLFLTGRSEVYRDTVVTKTLSDGGLALLDGFGPGEDTVYAVDNILTAVHLNIMHTTTGRPFPVVVYRPDTRGSWYYVQSKRVIFWTGRVTPEVVSNAARVGDRAYIAVDARMNITAHRDAAEIRRLSLQKIVTDVDAAAIPWDRVACRHLLKHPEDRSDFVDRLDITPRQRDAIVRACRTEEDRKVVVRYLKGAVTANQTWVNNKVIEERMDGYWMIPANSAPVQEDMQLTNFTLEDVTIMRLPISRDTRMHGTLIKDSVHIPFEGDEEAISRNPFKFFKNVVYDAGEGMVRIEKKWREYLLDIACELHKFKQYAVNESVGWDDRHKRFCFPRFNIQDGYIRAIPDFKLELPCRRVRQGFDFKTNEERRDVMHRLLQPTAEVATFWALTIATLRNLLAPVMRWRVSPIGLVVTRRDVEHAMGRWFVDVMDLVVQDPTRDKSGKKPPEYDHGVPDYVYVSPAVGSRAFKLIRDGVRDNVLMDVTTKEAAAGLVRNEWTFVTTGEDIGGHARTPRNLTDATRVIPEFLAWLQRQDGVMVEHRSPLKSTIDTVRKWVCDTFWLAEDINPKDTFRAVETSLKSGELSTVPMDQRFIDFLTTISGHNELPKPGRSTGHIVFDGEAVRLRLQPLVKWLCKAQYPVSFVEINEAMYEAGMLESGDDCVVISREAWVSRRIATHRKLTVDVASLAATPSADG
jgi:hypothetical protein